MTTTDRPPAPLDDLGFHVRRAVRWLSPRTWLTTGVTVWRGRRASVPAEMPPSSDPVPLDRPSPDASGNVWVDFVSDTGDGFDASTTVAWTLARPVLDVDGQRTLRGNVLVHGGDMVYPSGSDERYRNRFIGPMSSVFPDGGNEPPLLAGIPGNHDLHDGSGAWRRVMTMGRPIGGWRTGQADRWFALQLSDRWWVWAFDLQDGGIIGDGQRAYFDAIAADMAPGSQIIAVVSEPAWVRSRSRDARAAHALIEGELARGRARGAIRVWLTGDLHHYNRYVDRSGRAPVHYIVAGGGGAFLSATHSLPDLVRVDRSELELVEESLYPSRAESRRLVWTAPTLLWRNGAFPLVSAVVYAVAGWVLARGGDVARQWGDVIWSPGAASLAAFVLVASWLNTRQRSVRSAVAAAFHASLHLLVFAVLAAIIDVSSVPSALLFGLVGTLLGPLLIAVAFIVSNLMGLNDNELFSAIRVTDWRCFLRMRIDAHERLTILPIGIDETARAWLRNDRPVESGWIPRVVPATAISTRLIEAPIVVEPGEGAD